MSNVESESWITECDHDGHINFEQLLNMEFMIQNNLILCTGVTHAKHSLDTHMELCA